MENSSEQPSKCDHRLFMPIGESWMLCNEDTGNQWELKRAYFQQGMVRLKSFCIMINKWKSDKQPLPFCCWYTANQTVFYFICDQNRYDYSEAQDQNKFRNAYRQTLERLKAVHQFA